MNYRSLWRILLIAVMSIALTKPTRAESIDTAGKQVIAGIAVVAALGVLVIVLIVRHKSPKDKITGCIGSGTNGLSIIDESDKRAYALSGDTVGIKPGDRTTLLGKRNPKALVFQTRKVITDFGVCQP